MRLIDADALKEWIDEYVSVFKKSDNKDIKGYIEHQPTIEPKRGEWICHEGKWIDFDYYPTKYECNQCHHYVDVASDKKFCPNCGADMRERESE